MKLKVLSAAAIGLVMTACGGGSSSPEDTVKSFFDATKKCMFEKDCSSLKAVASPEIAELMGMVGEMQAFDEEKFKAEKEKAEKQKIESVKCETKEKVTTCKCKVSGEAKEQSIMLEEVDGAMKVVGMEGKKVSKAEVEQMKAGMEMMKKMQDGANGMGSQMEEEMKNMEEDVEGKMNEMKEGAENEMNEIKEDVENKIEEVEADAKKGMNEMKKELHDH